VKCRNSGKTDPFASELLFTTMSDLINDIRTSNRFPAAAEFELVELKRAFAPPNCRPIVPPCSLRKVRPSDLDGAEIVVCVSGAGQAPVAAPVRELPSLPAPPAGSPMFQSVDAGPASPAPPDEGQYGAFVGQPYEGWEDDYDAQMWAWMEDFAAADVNGFIAWHWATYGVGPSAELVAPYLPYQHYYPPQHSGHYWQRHPR
jgi:hypothetical protein